MKASNARPNPPLTLEKDKGNLSKEKMKASDNRPNPPLTLEKDKGNTTKESHEKLSEIQVSRAITLPLYILVLFLLIVAGNFPSVIYFEIFKSIINQKPQQSEFILPG